MRARFKLAARTLAWRALCWCLFALCAACTSKQSASEAKKGAPAPPALIRERPAAVLIELAWPKLEESWPLIRDWLGPRGTLLPSNPALALGAALGLDALSASTVDARATALLALVAAGGAAPVPVLGVGVESGAELVARLSTGSAPTHRAEVLGDVTLLTPHAGAAGNVLGVVDQTLLWGPRAALTVAGVYLARSAFRARPRESIQFEITQAAWQRELSPALQLRWQALRQTFAAGVQSEQLAHGRAADFAQPAVILELIDHGFAGVRTVLDSVTLGVGELKLSAQGAEITLRLLAPAGSAAAQWAATLTPANLDLLKELPAATRLALLLRRSDATDLDPNWQRAFGQNLSAADVNAVNDSWRTLSAGLGPTVAVGFLSDYGALLRAEVRDRELLRKGLAQSMALWRREPLLGPATSFLGKPRLKSSQRQLAGLDVDEFQIEFQKTNAGKAERRITLDSAVAAERMLLAGAIGPQAPIEQGALALRDGVGLASDPQVGALLANAAQSSLLLYVDLAKVGLSKETPAATFLALSARENAPELRLAGTRAAVRVALGAVLP